MADANQVADELARTLARLNEDLALYGKVSIQTQNDIKDAQLKAKYGIENYTKGTEKAAEGVMALGRAGFAAGKAMLDGKKGASALNSSLEELSTAATAAGAALALMIPGGILIKGLVAGITAATGAFIKYTQAANEMADQLHKGYQGLARAGGAAADGMTGLKRDAQKLGLAMTELDQMVSIVAENSKDFALFAGSVSEGRKRFAEMGQAMEPARRGLMNMGLSMQDINEGAAGYLRIQTITGRSQKMTTDQLARGATEYLKEQDALTKLTGQSRKEMETNRERALQNEQFQAKILELRNRGEHKVVESLMKMNDMYGAAGPQMQAAFHASVTGNLASEDARKANFASNGEMIRSTQMVIDKQISEAEAVQRTGVQFKNTADTLGTTLGQFSAYNNVATNLTETVRLSQFIQGDVNKNFEKIKEDQAKQLAGADKITDNQSKLVLTQIEANKAMTDFIFKGIGPAQEKMIALTEASLAAANALNKIANAGDGSKVNATPTQNTQLSSVGANYQAKDDERKAMMEALNDPKVSDRDKEWMRQQLKNMPARAAGGPVAAGKSYLVGEKGPEVFVPSVSGQIVPNADMAGTGGEQLDKMNNLYKEMLKDTVALEKLTDTDLKRYKEYDRLASRLMNLKTNLMEDELELLDEQNETLKKMLEIAESAGGKESAAAMKKAFTMARMNMASGIGTLNDIGSMNKPDPNGMNMQGANKMNMPSATSMLTSGSGAPVMSGSGLPIMTGAAAAPGMGGAQGLQIKDQNDLKSLGLRLKTGDVQAEGAKISPKIIELAKAIQSSVPNFGMFTGFNDKFHNEKAPSSQHTKGLAVDFTVAKPPTKEEGKAVTDWLKQMGASLALDEYNNPSAGATAGHYHAQIPAFKDGGLVDEATLSLIGEGGPEAVIPLKDGNVPVSFNGKMGLGDEAMGLFKVMAEQTAAMAAMMEQMVSAQKSSVDVQNKMLRAQS